MELFSSGYLAREWHDQDSRRSFEQSIGASCSSVIASRAAEGNVYFWDSASCAPSLATAPLSHASMPLLLDPYDVQ